jgi:hypothetical protein
MPKHREEPPTLDVELSELYASGKSAMDTELAFQKARAALALKLVGRIAGYGALVCALLFFVLMALVVGLLLALGPVLGAWGALGVVMVGLVVATGAAALAAKATLGRLLKLFAADDAP